MEEIKNRTQTRRPQNNLVLSLPSGAEGQRMKESLRKLASENHRSISNQVSIILRDYLRSEKRF